MTSALVTISVNPYSLVDLGMLLMAIPLAVAFYAIYWYLDRPADLIFAHLLLCFAVYAFASFMVDNARDPVPALFWHTVIFLSGSLALPVVVHFAYAFIGAITPVIKRLLVALYVLGGVLALATQSPLFLSPASHDRGPVSWHNVSPWLPEAGPLLSVFVFAWLSVLLFTAVTLWRHL